MTERTVTDARQVELAKALMTVWADLEKHAAESLKDYRAGAWSMGDVPEARLMSTAFTEGYTHGYIGAALDRMRKDTHGILDAAMDRVRKEAAGGPS